MAGAGVSFPSGGAVSLAALRRPLNSAERRCGERDVDPTSGPARHPLFEKFESEHVTQFLSQTHETDQEERTLRRSGRWFHFGYTILGLGVFVFLSVLLLPDQSELYTEIMKSVCLFAAGAAGGYGLKAYQDQRRSQAR